MRCDATVAITYNPVSALFQSLSGFLMRCDGGEVRWDSIHIDECFNPYRVF